MTYNIYLNEKLYDYKRSITECFKVIDDFCAKKGRNYDIFCINTTKDFGKECITVKLNHDFGERYYTFKIKVYLDESFF